MECAEKTGKQSPWFLLELWKKEVDQRGGLHQRQSNNSNIDDKGTDDRWRLSETAANEHPDLSSNI